MATYKVDCAGCHRQFTAKAPNAKWHSSACKKRAARVQSSAKAAAERAESPLVERLRADLTEAGVQDSFDGLLALELAERVAKAGPSGFSPLARELRSVRAAALGEDPPDEPGAEDEDEDEPAPDPGMALILEIEGRRDSKRADASATG